MAFDRKPIIEEVEEYEPKSVEIIISGQKIKVYEMSLTSLEQATRIVEPHLVSVLRVFQSEEFIGAAKGELDTEVLVKQVMETLRSKVLGILADAPVAVLKAIACMMNADPEDSQILNILRNATPRELMETLEKLNELNDFKQVLAKMTEILGYLKGRYIPTEPTE